MAKFLIVKVGIMPMKRTSWMVAVALSATGLAANAQQPRREEPIKVAAPIAVRSDDEKAIKSLLETFTKAFDSGNAAAAAATYTETAVVVDEEGQRTEGRAAIQAQYEVAFKEAPGSTIAIKVDALRFLGPETALEVGRCTITPAKGVGPPEHTRFTTVYVKNEGKWLQAAVRDEAAKVVSPHDQLTQLEWLVGEWVNESQDAIVSTTCKWTADGQFLVRDFTMKTKGNPVLSGTQRIGWDPLKKQFKTWIFDTQGGHAEGYWTHNGDEWTIKLEGVRQDGLPLSATNIVRRQGKDKMSWASMDRTVGGVAIPGVDEFMIVRKPPEVGK
jgi:uncharacterized protein (TIGR02246 family)